MDPLARFTQRQQPRTTLHLAADPAEVDRLASLRGAAAAGDPDAADELAEAEAQLVTVDITLEALGSLFDDLVAQAPPTDSQRHAVEASGRAALGYDPAKLGPALLVAMVRRFAYSDAPADAVPVLGEREAERLWESLHHGDRDEVLAAAIGLCRTSTRVGDLGKG